jgi:hypothetical protein
MTVQFARNYFSETATDEMMREWEGMLDPAGPNFLLGHCLLVVFLPVHIGQHMKWLQRFLNLWSLFRGDEYDFQFVSLFAPPSRYGYEDIEWGNILPFLFNIVGNMIGIPTTLLQTAMAPVAISRLELYPVFQGFRAGRKCFEIVRVVGRQFAHRQVEGTRPVVDRAVVPFDRTVLYSRSSQ